MITEFRRLSDDADVVMAELCRVLSCVDIVMPERLMLIKQLTGRHRLPYTAEAGADVGPMKPV